MLRFRFKVLVTVTVLSVVVKVHVHSDTKIRKVPLNSGLVVGTCFKKKKKKKKVKSLGYVQFTSVYH